MYYLRTKVAADVIKLTVNEVMLSIPALGSEDALLFECGQEYVISIEEQQVQLSCSLDNPKACRS